MEKEGRFRSRENLAANCCNCGETWTNIELIETLLLGRILTILSTIRWILVFGVL